MLKVLPASGYPPEEGRYLRGNDYSPVAVVVILIHDQEKIPPDIENLVRVGVESGAALSGTLQTENIGIEKLVAPTPYLFNLPLEHIERFRKQVQIINLLNEGDPELLRRAVWACYQEVPTPFRGYMLYDPGAYPEAPLSGRLTWRVTRPEAEPKDETERQQRGKLRELMARQAAEKRDIGHA